jgi:transmembrane sensor
MEDKLRRIPPHALPVLAQSGKDGRRKALRALGFVAMAGGTAYVLRNTSAWQAALADYSTATGEIRHVTLSDGTRLTLDTASAVDVRFDAVARLVALRSGTLLASTAPHPDKGGPGGAARPFLVQSPQGTVRALGTRFTVSRDGPVSHVAVYQGADRRHRSQTNTCSPPGLPTKAMQRGRKACSWPSTCAYKTLQGRWAVTAAAYCAVIRSRQTCASAASFL